MHLPELEIFQVAPLYRGDPFRLGKESRQKPKWKKQNHREKVGQNSYTYHLTISPKWRRRQIP